MNDSTNLSLLTNGVLEERYLEAKKQIPLDRFHYLQQGSATLNNEEKAFSALYKEMWQRGLISAGLTLPSLREFNPIHDALDRMQRHLSLLYPAAKKHR